MSNLKPIDVKRRLEILKSKEDARYWLRSFYHIPVIGTGPALFDLRDYQDDILRDLMSYKMIIALKARQIGMTTVTVAFAVWDALFHENHPWLLVSKNEDGAKKMLGRAMYGYDRLPGWMKQQLPQVVSRTQTVVEFDNGSRIEAVPSVSSTGRGDSVFGAILDEYAFMDYPAEVYAALEPLIYGKMIIISTANGMGNRFHDIWLDSEMDETVWHGMFFSWDVVESRDDEWYEQKKMSFRGQEWYFYQEYPSTPQEAFAKSGRTVFSPDLLASYEWEEPERFYEWTDEGFVETSDPTPNALRVWEEPQVLRDAEHGYVVQQPNYVIGCDVAEGKEDGDYTAITVWDANDWKLVASMYAHFPLEDLDELLFDLGEWYFWALLTVERNHYGIAVIVGLQRNRYPRIYRAASLARTRSRRSLDMGWVTSKKTKPKMVVDMLNALNARDVWVRDPIFREEAKTFLVEGDGGFGAISGKHDDFVMSTLIGFQGVLDVGKYPRIWEDLKDRPLTFGDVFSIQDHIRPKGGIDQPLGNKTYTQEVVREGFLISPANVK